MDQSALLGQGQSALNLAQPPVGKPFGVADVDWRPWGYPYPLVPETDTDFTPAYPDVEWEVPKRAC